MTDKLYEFVVRGREVPLREPHTSRTTAQRRAHQLANERNRQVRVYRDRAGAYEQPLYIANPAPPRQAKQGDGKWTP